MRAAAESQQAKGRQAESEAALTDKMAEFLKKQAEKESGVLLSLSYLSSRNFSAVLLEEVGTHATRCATSERK